VEIDYIILTKEENSKTFLKEKKEKIEKKA